MKTKQSNYQMPFFIIGMILFTAIAVFGWIKLQYGFNFIDEGYHMTKSWRLTAGDHFFDDQYMSILRPYTLINSLIFRINPNITLLGFRQLQFILTLIALFFFSVAIYTANKKYWYFPFIFSVFAFTGLDPVGMISNLNYFTYPHLFLSLSLACLIIGFQLNNILFKRTFFIISGFFLWLISLSLLHLSVIILFPIIYYFLSRIFHFKYFHLSFKDCILVSSPFMIGWLCFIAVYQKTFFATIFKSLHFFLSLSMYSPEALKNFNIWPFVYVAIATLFLVIYLSALKKIPLKASFVFFPALSVLAYVIIETSCFGFIQPYFSGWLDRPMWFASFLIGFYLIFWTGLLKNYLLKQDITKSDELVVLLLIPVTLLAIVSTVFSGLGPLTVLYCAIPGVTGLTIYFRNNPVIQEQKLFTKLILIIAVLAPIYSSTILNDWKNTFFDVAPGQMSATIEKGFGKGIKTNIIYQKLYKWVADNADAFTGPDDFLLSYELSPMTHMITKLRPSLDDTFIDFDIPHIYYKNAIESMEKRGRNPMIAFIFERRPILLPVSLEEQGTMTFPPKRFDFMSSHDPLSTYVKAHMAPAAELTISEDYIIRCFVDKKRFEEKSDNAITELQKKIIQEPENVMLHYQLGLAFEQKNNFKKARQSYQQSLALQPDDFNTLNRLTMIHIKEKNYADAIALLSGPMLKIQPDNADIYYNISCLFAIQNDQKKAIEWLSLALGKGYDNWEKIKTDPDLENIRNSTYYQESIENHKLDFSINSGNTPGFLPSQE